MKPEPHGSSTTSNPAHQAPRICHIALSLPPAPSSSPATSHPNQPFVAPTFSPPEPLVLRPLDPTLSWDPLYLCLLNLIWPNLAMFFPLLEVARVDSLLRVHDPFH